jgi:hypothetical protein
MNEIVAAAANHSVSELQKTINLVIFAFPGLGGNHLANLIATSGLFHYPVDYTKYFKDTKSNAHYLVDTSIKPNIFLYHFGSANDQEISHLCASAPTKFLVIHFPLHNQLAKLRIKMSNNIDLTSHFVYDLQKIYKSQFLEKIYPGEWFTVMSDDLFSMDVNKIIRVIESILGSNLEQKKLIHDIHESWIAKLEKNPYPF